jgi:D-alanyl-D-alanine carboxypeptidase
MISSLISIIFASNISLHSDIIKESDSLIKTSNSSESLVKDNLMIAPIISAKSAITIDLKTSTVLFEKESNKKAPFASITKLMTALIILEENQMDEIVKVSSNATSEPGSTMGLFTGENITVKNLIYGALINSGNDASTALAEHNAGSKEAFVFKMNQKVNNLGLYNTHFQNPTGLDHPNHYSSASDIAKIAEQIYKNDLIKEIVITKNTKVTNVENTRTHYLKNTNHLLDSYLNIKGLKTGTTIVAKECLVIIAELENGRELLTVVLGSNSRFNDTKILIDWAEKAYFTNKTLNANSITKHN